MYRFCDWKGATCSGPPGVPSQGYPARVSQEQQRGQIPVPGSRYPPAPPWYTALPQVRTHGRHGCRSARRTCAGPVEHCTLVNLPVSGRPWQYRPQYGRTHSQPCRTRSHSGRHVSARPSSCQSRPAQVLFLARQAKRANKGKNGQ